MDPENRVSAGVGGRWRGFLPRLCLGVQRSETVLVKLPMPSLQGAALQGLGGGVDVGRIQVLHGVSEQLLPDHVVHADIGPGRACYLPEVVARPFALGQMGEQGVGIARAQRCAVAAREQQRAAVALTVCRRWYRRSSAQAWAVSGSVYSALAPV